MLVAVCQSTQHYIQLGHNADSYFHKNQKERSQTFQNVLESLRDIKLLLLLLLVVVVVVVIYFCWKTALNNNLSLFNLRRNTYRVLVGQTEGKSHV